jgi:hypothetical protein
MVETVGRQIAESEADLMESAVENEIHALVDRIGRLYEFRESLMGEIDDHLPDEEVPEHRVSAGARGDEGDGSLVGAYLFEPSAG